MIRKVRNDKADILLCARYSNKYIIDKMISKFFIFFMFQTIFNLISL